jgi:uncharacterized protein
MSRSRLRLAAAFGAGALFGVGLLLSGMTQPAKVLGFLDVFGEFDPSLIFVMGGAIPVYAAAYAWSRRRPAALLDSRFHLPERQRVDVKLIGGAALFGVGWGLGGYCPGPAVVSLPGAGLATLGFLIALLIGRALSAQLFTPARPAAVSGDYEAG